MAGNKGHASSPASQVHRPRLKDPVALHQVQALGPNDCATINDPASVGALTQWSQLVSVDHISPVGQTGADADTLFAARKAALEINGPWAAAGYQSAGINLGIAPVPVGSAGPVTLASTVPLMIERTTPHAAQAEEFLACPETLEVVEHVVIGGEDLLATNSKETADKVIPRTSLRHRLDGTRLSVELPPVSWTMTRLQPVTG